MGKADMSLWVSLYCTGCFESARHDWVMHLGKVNAKCGVGLFVEPFVLEEIKIQSASSRNIAGIVR